MTTDTETRRSADHPAIDLVVSFLMAEFEGAASAELIAFVVSGARSDLGSDVPPEALPEFTHRLARQRLMDGHHGSAGNRGATGLRPHQDADPASGVGPRRPFSSQAIRHG